jgi:hypothetical protein
MRHPSGVLNGFVAAVIVPACNKSNREIDRIIASFTPRVVIDAESGPVRRKGALCRRAL